MTESTKAWFYSLTEKQRKSIRSKVWREKNKVHLSESNKAAMKRYRAKHRNELNAYARCYYSEHLEEIKAKAREKRARTKAEKLKFEGSHL
jgi:hypothetical protein